MVRTIALRRLPFVRMGRRSAFMQRIPCAALPCSVVLTVHLAACSIPQVLLHESTWNAVRSVAELNEGLVLFRNMGDHKLKGISRKVYVIQVRRRRRRHRRLPPMVSKRQ